MPQYTNQRVHGCACRQLVAWFGGQARLDVTKAWLAQLWNEYGVAWVIISLGRTEQGECP